MKHWIQTNWRNASYIILALIILFYPVYAYFKKFWWELDFEISGNQEIWAHFGDYIGGIIGPILSFITLIFVIVSLIEQRNNNNQQSKYTDKESELKDFQNRLSNQRELFNQLQINDFSTRTINQIKGAEAIQNLIQNELFSQLWTACQLKAMLHYNTLADNLDITVQNKISKHINNIRDVNLRAAYINNPSTFLRYNNPFELLNGEPRYIKEILIKNMISTLSIEENIQVLQSASDGFYKSKGFIYGHLVRNYFHFISGIAEFKNNDTSTLIKYARSFLSSPEILLLFYNLFSSNNTKKFSALLFDNEIFDEIEVIPFLHSEFVLDNMENIKEYCRNNLN
jgi:uncharacterized membrane protein